MDELCLPFLHDCLRIYWKQEKLRAVQEEYSMVN